MVQQPMRTIYLSLATIFLSACHDYEAKPLTTLEKEQLVKEAESYIGVPYKFGGQDISGMDCSGLLVLAMNGIGYSRFYDGDDYVHDVTADTFFNFNTFDVEESDLEYGDLIFFDTDFNGVQEHVSIFLYWDKSGAPTVLDAYSIAGKVEVRIVSNFDSKNPSYGEMIGYR